MMCAFNSQSFTFLFIEQFGKTLFVKFARGYLDPFEAFVGNGISQLKTRQKDSQKLLCDVCIQLTDLNLSFHRAALKHSRRRTFNGIFGLLWGLRWKREYLDIKSKQKHSQKLLSDVCIQLTDFNIPFHRAVLKLSFRRICKYIFGLLWGLCWKCKYLPRKSREKHSQILFVMFAFNSRRWTYLFIEQLWNTLFVESASGYLECFEAFIGTRNIFT